MAIRRIGVGVLGVLLTVSSPLESTIVVPPAAAATPAPAFELVTLAGEGYSNVSLKGKPALLIFWAPWCKVCQRELPTIGRFYKQDKPASVEVISVGFADTRSNVEAFVKARAETFVFPTAYDEDRWVSRAFKVNATPTYVILDTEGAIALVHRGGGLLQNAQFQEFLQGLNR